MATTEQFSLRWNNFHSNLTTGFHELLEAAEMVDVTIAVDGHFLQAHKLVLSICSPYFKEMFKVNPCKHPIVILKDVAHENMKDILEFMYMGEVSVLRENLSTFLRTAEVLQVKGLTGDDSSDTSSRKDDKLDGGDTEDEMSYNQIIEPEVELPSPTPPPSKRPSKSNSNSSATKRAKAEQTPATAAAQNQNDFESTTELVKPKMESNFTENSNSESKTNNEADERFPGKNFWDSTTLGSSGSTDPNLSDHGTQDAKFNRNAYHQCVKCLKKFSRRDHLRTHEKNIHGEDAGPFVCSICFQLYKNTESLRKHFTKFHIPKMNCNTKVELNVTT